LGVLEINKERVNYNIAKPIIFSILYTIYFYVALKFIVESNMLISSDSITKDNVGIRFIGDFFVTLFVPLILVVIYRKKLKEFKLQFKHTYIQYILIGFMILFFFLHNDYTIRGYYKFFFYLIAVGFSEEFVFRGYVYNGLLRYNKSLAVIVSGFFWGILHAILPGLMAGHSVLRIAIGMLYEIGGGILFGYYFIYLLEKSNSLFIPIFIHAILDYQVAGIGVAVSIATGMYFFIKDRKNAKAIIDKENNV